MIIIRNGGRSIPVTALMINRQTLSKRRGPAVSEMGLLSIGDGSEGGGGGAEVDLCGGGKDFGFDGWWFGSLVRLDRNWKE